MQDADINLHFTTLRGKNSN